jgi:hypothetical protein
LRRVSQPFSVCLSRPLHLQLPAAPKRSFLCGFSDYKFEGISHFFHACFMLRPSNTH